MKRLFEKMYQTTGLVNDPGQRSVASRVSALIVEATLVFVVLGTLGVDTSPLIAAAGVTGATIGFACKDFGANFVASIALSSNDAMRTGNRVTIGTGPNAVTGIIDNWDTRYLYLRTAHNYVMCVPNNLILNSVVVVEKNTAAAAAAAAATEAAQARPMQEAAAAATASPVEADATATSNDDNDGNVAVATDGIDDDDGSGDTDEANATTTPPPPHTRRRRLRKNDKEWRDL